MAYNEDVNVNLNVLTGTLGGITAIMGGMSALTSSFGAMGTAAAESFGTLDGLLVSATALISTFAIQSAEAFGQYEQGMKIVQTVSGQTSQAMSQLSETANQMSIAYRTSIGDINDGLQTLGRAGLNSANEQLEVLESGLQTAKLEGRNLNGVLEELIQNTAMLGGDLKSIDFGEQTEYLNSLMVGTSMTAPITSHDISQTLQYAGGTAAAAGANLENKDKLEDLMGTIAAFAQKGVKGSMSGTALRAFFTKPASQDKSVTDALSSIGLSPEDLWEDGGESMKKVSDQVGIIKNRMDALNLSTMDQVELWGKIVGPKMGQQMMKLDSSAIKDLTKDIHEANSAEQLATQTLHTYTQKLAEMQQQGELAYREFGQKVVVFLTPIVELITKILGVLSHPAGSVAAFAAVGSLLAHGISKAWAMITSIFNQIRGLFSEVVAGIENINALAGGSATGFTQSASQVDFLNKKLYETDAVLQSIQAKAMGIRPGYQLPLGLYTDKVPKRTFQAYGENVVVDRAGVMGKGQGAILSGDQQSALNKRIDDFGNKIKDQTVNRMPGFMGGGQAFTQESINKGVDTYVKGLRDESVSKVRTELKLFNKDEYQQWLQRQEGRGEAGKYSLRRAGDFYNADGTVNTKSTVGQQYGAELKKYLKQGYYIVPESHLPAKSHPNAQALGQKLNDGTVDKMVAQRNKIITQQQNELLGKAGINAKAYQLGSEKIGGFTKNVGTAGSALASFGRHLKQLPQTISQWRERSNRGLEFWGGRSASGGSNLSDFQKRAQFTLQDSNFVAQNKGLDLKTITANLRKELNLTATEFSALINTEEQFRAVFGETTELVGQDFRELGIQANSLRDTIAGLTVTKEEEAMSETEAGAEVIAAKKAEAAESLKAAAADEIESASSAMSGFSGLLQKGGQAVSTLTGYMGGPFMAAMIAFTAVSSIYQGAVSDWQKKVSDATNQMSEAKDKMSSAEDNIKQLFSSENNTISEANLEKIVDYQHGSIQESYNADLDKHGAKTKPKFSDMYDNEVVKVQSLSWSDEEKENYTLKTAEDLEALNESTETLTLAEEENIKKLEENTVALNHATYLFSQALNKEAKAFNDPTFGFKGIDTKQYNATGMDGILKYMPIVKDAAALYTTASRAIANEGFFDYDSPVLTPYMNSDKYEGSKEFAPILSSYIYTEGTEAGLKGFFGSDFDSLVTMVDHIEGKTGSTVEYLNTLSNNAFQGMSDEDMALAQMLWKEDPETIQRLGKQMYWSETEHPGYSAMESWHTGELQKRNPKENHPSSKDFYQKVDKQEYTVNDKNLKNTMDKIYNMTNGKLSYSNMLAMGQMQMLSDMYSVANEQIYPALSQTMIAASQNVLATGQAGSNAGSAASGAGAAANNAAVIAGMLGEKLKKEANGLEYENDYLNDPKGPQKYNFLGIQFGGVMSEEEFTKRMADMGDSSMNKYRENKWRTEAQWTARISHPEWGEDAVNAYADRSLNKILDENGNIREGVSKNIQHIDNTILGPGLTAVQQMTRAAYEQSDIGEYGGNTGSGGGSGGSGDGSDKNKDKSGTRKERVDLVLCNKKEIPKLNVNLFKKPPNFTVLNKNFKLRDIKINSQDKPKAIMNAIKNGIIETQKRMDPKIIQDEAGEYNPLEATEGSPTPSGTTETTT